MALFTGVAVSIVTIYLAHKLEMLDPQCLADMAALGRLKLINVAEVHQVQLLALTINGNLKIPKLIEEIRLSLINLIRP